MCGVSTPKQVPQKEPELIAAPTYADAATQSAVASARKQALKNNGENIKTSARGLLQQSNTQQNALSGGTLLKKTLGE